MAYDFSTIDANDFELLARDLLNAKFGLDLQSFKSGKDRGIDLRVSTPENPNAIIVQVKHYLKSGFLPLSRDLEQIELPKVRTLQPGKYMIVTSVSLSPQEKDSLVKLLSPYLHSSNEIFGKEDLNKYLSELPNIETKWYKLWLTSVDVLGRIVQNGTLGANEFVSSKILRTTQLYVHCPSYDVAFDILKEHKYLLITGQPGVGKTTLAYFLTYNYLANGYQLLHIDTDISQATEHFKDDPSIKQVIFFDDFLGENYLEVNRPKTTESAFVLFLERIMASENKYLILTTRTTIYNNALDKYEKMERMKVSVARREIVLDQYTILDKARILYKHVYFSDIPLEYKTEICSSQNYWKIIEHTNYNPRLIEFITQKKHVPAELPEGYLAFVLNNLKNPKEVWKYFYREQLNTEERLLLHVVFTQNYSAKTADTKMMFLYMLNYEVEKYNFRPGLNPFQSSLKRLLDGTLKKEIGWNTDRVTFINPSIADFLKFYFLQNEEERTKLLNGTCTIEQFENYKQSFFTFERPNTAEISMFVNLLIDDADKLSTYAELKREKSRDAYVTLRAAALLNGLYGLDTKTENRAQHFIFNSISNYPIENINPESRKYYCQSVRYSNWGGPLYEYLQANWTAIINGLFLACLEENDFDEVKELFDEYNQNYDVFIKDEDNLELLSCCLRDFVDNRTADWIRDEQLSVFSDEDWRKMKANITKKRESIFRTFQIEDDWFDEEGFFNSTDVNDLIEINTGQKKASLKNQLNNTQRASTTKDEDLVKEVELLFRGEYEPTFVKNKAEEIGLPF